METDKNDVLLDKTGVIDPGCDQLSGWSFTASALQNLACNLHQAEDKDQEKNNPGLVLHHAHLQVYLSIIILI